MNMRLLGRLGLALVRLGSRWLLDNRRCLVRVDRGDVVGHGLIFVDPDVASVRAHETFVEDAAGKLVEFLFFQGAQQTGADLGAERDVVERDAALLALFSQTIAERSHATPSPSPAYGSILNKCQARERGVA